MPNPFRLIVILGISLRYGLSEFFSPSLAKLHTRLYRAGRAERLRLALERLGPLFVKFGQFLSMRSDLLPQDIVEELGRLQDKVPPFGEAEVRRVLDEAYSNEWHSLFDSFDFTPVASGSVAQVHFATLSDGEPVAVKLLRPGIHHTIQRDLTLLRWCARLGNTLYPITRCLHLQSVIDHLSKHLAQELDLLIEAAHCSKLKQNFPDQRLLLIPDVYWQACRKTAMVMERMQGIPISQIALLEQQGIDLSQLARDGVEIFFTQAFRDGFFHADMHPGNILVSSTPPHQGRYVALDFGIMGTLSEQDRHYLARNFLAFFQRDYQQVVRIHLESGWIPSDTPQDELEMIVRSVCEPVFNRPLKDISFARILIGLFQASNHLNIEVQPQLVMLQKTLLNIESLGKVLDPNLDLWQTAQPCLKQWMSTQTSWRSTLRKLRHELPCWLSTLPRLPRLIHDNLTTVQDMVQEQLHRYSRAQEARARRRRHWVTALVCFVLLQTVVLTGLLITLLR